MSLASPLAPFIEIIASQEGQRQTSEVSAAFPDFRKAAPPVRRNLFQGNLAHELVAHDFADFQTLDR